MDLQLAFRLEVPLDWERESRAASDLLERVRRDEDLALDVADYMLSELQAWTRAAFRGSTPHELATHAAAALAVILYKGGSEWEVGEIEAGRSYELTRRAVGPVRDVIVATGEISKRAQDHLLIAWSRLAGRNPDPSAAYREAVRAVEAVAKPVVTPHDEGATLGKMIAAMRDKPEKWTTTIGSVDDVRRMMQAVWNGQDDRHGTDDESVPLHVSAEAADAAFHMSLTLVRLFAGRHVVRVSVAL
jgi:hypothetical protein